jgi:hypothetical protein
MTLDWTAIATIAAPLLALFVGAWLDRWLETRPILISYFGHVSSFRYTADDGQEIIIHTHAVVLRNTGRRPATGVRIHHQTLPSFSIWPSVVYTTEELPDKTRDILIPTLVPGEEVTISYLYFPPLTVDRVNAGIKYDQGFATAVPVLLQRQYGNWANRIVGTLMLAGLVAIIYVLIWAIRRYLL